MKKVAGCSEKSFVETVQFGVHQLEWSTEIYTKTTTTKNHWIPIRGNELKFQEDDYRNEQIVYLYFALNKKKKHRDEKTKIAPKWR